jgi:hypothetical protein
MARTESGPYFNENARQCRQACAIDAAGAKGRSAPCVSSLVVSTRRSVSLISCRDQIVLVAESVTCIRHFLPKFNFLRCFERRDQFPFPVRPQAPVASWKRASVYPSLTLQHACADLNTVGRSKPSALDPGNVSIISSHFPLVSIHLLRISAFLTVLGPPTTAWQELRLERR